MCEGFAEILRIGSRWRPPRWVRRRQDRDRSRYRSSGSRTLGQKSNGASTYSEREFEAEGEFDGLACGPLGYLKGLLLGSGEFLIVTECSVDVARALCAGFRDHRFVVAEKATNHRRPSVAVLAAWIGEGSKRRTLDARSVGHVPPSTEGAHSLPRG